ncbi:hypothetical protein EVAR_16714_1 [Eumeta japonica]|uniref:Uncharacterized protein n=1 Tax=Eumeta variegata TaxID=151549 RepID=A0A4C1V5N2_EUMVA|nr:hypothetical protein EVAR_16714_1 [Eumeta japonica]
MYIITHGSARLDMQPILSSFISMDIMDQDPNIGPGSRVHTIISHIFTPKIDVTGASVRARLSRSPMSRERARPEQRSAASIVAFRVACATVTRRRMRRMLCRLA